MHELHPDVGHRGEEEVAADKSVERLGALTCCLTRAARDARSADQQEHAKGQAPCSFERIYKVFGRLLLAKERALHPLEGRGGRRRRLSLRPERLGHRVPGGAADEAHGEAEENISVRDEHGDDLGRANQDKVGRDGEDHSRQEGLHRLVQGQHPGETALADEGGDGLLEEGLDDAKLETHAQQRAGNQRRVLAVARIAHHRQDDALQRAVDPVARPAHWLEVTWVEHGACVLHQRRGLGEPAPRA
mmetsp:Transcript_17005/g.43558  ORF Transcript_17005/g.43558 Transcript_17005/m.43558 type:complete len:246 (+) Transcript_17005:370-1107(+)